MYQVPPSRDSGSNSLYNSHEDRCPRCGSRRQLPADGMAWGLRQVPRSMQRFICAECGTRYRVTEPLPTWRDLGQDVLFYVGAFIVLVLVILLLL